MILVTGAGRGIGRVAALTFAKHGATVILHGRDVAKLESVYDEIEAAGGAQATILPLDLATASDRDFENMAQAIESQLKRLDGIVHNASHFTHLGPLEDEAGGLAAAPARESHRALRTDARLHVPAARRTGRIGDPYGRDARARTQRLLGRVRGIQERTACAQKFRRRSGSATRACASTCSCRAR